MAILDTLGLNNTLFIQLAIFVVTYLVFSTLVFKPYLASHIKRAAMTNFGEATASHLLSETKDITLKYEFKAREVSEHIDKVFDSARLEAQHQYDEVVKKARDEAEKKLLAARKEIDQTVQRVRGELTQGIPGVSVEISNKLLGKQIEV